MDRRARNASRNRFMQDSSTLGRAEGIDRIRGDINEEEAIIAETLQPRPLAGALQIRLRSSVHCLNDATK